MVSLWPPDQHPISCSPIYLLATTLTLHKQKPSTPPVPPAPPASAVSPTTPGSPALHIPELASPIHFTNDISASRVDAVNNLYRAISNLGDNHPERQHHLQHIIEGPTEHLEHSFITYLETLKVHIDTPVGRVAGAEDAIKHRMPGGVMTVIMLLLLGLWLGLGLGFGFGYEVGLVLGQQSMLKAFLAGA